jgi:hypothetical protein
MNPGKTFQHLPAEGSDEGFGGFLAEPGFHDDACVAEQLQATTGSVRSGVGAAHNDATESGVEQGVNAGRCFAVVATGFKSNEDVLSCCVSRSRIDGVDFGVRSTELCMPAFGNELSVRRHDHGPHRRVGFDGAEAAGGQQKCVLHDGRVRLELHVQNPGSDWPSASRSSRSRRMARR